MLQHHLPTCKALVNTSVRYQLQATEGLHVATHHFLLRVRVSASMCQVIRIILSNTSGNTGKNASTSLVAREDYLIDVFGGRTGTHKEKENSYGKMTQVSIRCLVAHHLACLPAASFISLVFPSKSLSMCLFCFRGTNPMKHIKQRDTTALYTLPYMHHL